MVMKLAEKEQQFNIEKAELANGHQAYFASVEGAHTPGVNSDFLYLNLDKADQRPNASRLLALITDGVSGRKVGLGRYAAQFICENVPTYWETDLTESPFKFSKKNRLPHSGKNPQIQELFEWMINNIDHRIFPIEMIRYVMRRHADLFINYDNQTLLANAQGKSAHELASLVLIEQERFQEVLRLLVALYQSISLGKADFERKYRGEAAAMPGLYAGTTCSGVIETPKDYILFGIGDSPMLIVDEIGPFSDKVTKNYEAGSRVLSSVLGWVFDEYNQGKTANLMAPPGCRFADGKLLRPSYVSVVYQPKDELFGNYAIVGLTDGIASSRRAIEEIGDTISLQVRNCRWAVKEVVERALEKDQEKFEKNPKYIPDDKTMVIISKSAPDF